MESLGNYLKRERELKNISLSEIAKNTRVREHLLKAIEKDQYDLLPSGAYVKSFLSTYAKYVGLDPNDVILRYQRALEEERTVPSSLRPPKRVLWDVKHPWKFGRTGAFAGIIGGLVVAALIALYFLFYRPSAPPPALSIPEKMTPSVPENPKAEEIRSSASEETRVKEVPPSASSPKFVGTALEREGKSFSLQLKADERAWVRIQVDGQPEREMTFNPGEGTSHQAMDRIHLIVGNAGGLDLVFNGRTLEKFGKSGEVVTLTFTPQGVETSLKAKQP